MVWYPLTWHNTWRACLASWHERCPPESPRGDGWAGRPGSDRTEAEPRLCSGAAFHTAPDRSRDQTCPEHGIAQITIHGYTVLRIRDGYPKSEFFHPASRSQKVTHFVCKLSEIWSGMFIPDPISLLSTHPGSRIQGSKRHRIPDLDPQTAVNHKQTTITTVHLIPALHTSVYGGVCIEDPVGCLSRILIFVHPRSRILKKPIPDQNGTRSRIRISNTAIFTPKQWKRGRILALYCCCSMNNETGQNHCFQVACYILNI